MMWSAERPMCEGLIVPFVKEGGRVGQYGHPLRQNRRIQIPRHVLLGTRTGHFRRPPV